MTQENESKQAGGPGKGCLIAVGVLVVAIIAISRACGCGSAEKAPEEYPDTESVPTQPQGAWFDALSSGQQEFYTKVWQEGRLDAAQLEQLSRLSANGHRAIWTLTSRGKSLDRLPMAFAYAVDQENVVMECTKCGKRKQLLPGGVNVINPQDKCPYGDGWHDYQRVRN